MIPYDGGMHIAYRSSIEYTDVKIESPKYEIALRTSDGLIPVLQDVSFRPMAEGQAMTVALPEALTDQDIVGSIAITVNGEIKGYIDVLVFRINYYSPTAFLMESLISVFFFIARNWKQIYALRVCKNGYCLFTRKLNYGTFFWPKSHCYDRNFMYKYEYDNLLKTIEI